MTPKQHRDGPGRKRKAKFHIDQVVFRNGFDDYARITKMGTDWVTFQDGRFARIQYLRKLTKCEATGR